MRLDYDFFARETTVVAQELLGKVMEYRSISGIIVETEAYLGLNDPGSHSFRGKTKRNAVMFGQAGISYIYQIYGVHYCYNVTTDRGDIPAAVLIRALQPMTGIEIMKKNRQKEKIRDLCSGPGKLVQALDIPISLNGTNVVNGPVGFYDSDDLGDFQIVKSTRIGLSQGKESLLRYYVEHNPFISKK